MHHTGQARLTLETRGARCTVDGKRQLRASMPREQRDAGAARPDRDVVPLTPADECRDAVEVARLEVQRQ